MHARRMAAAAASPHLAHAALEAARVQPVGARHELDQACRLGRIVGYAACIPQAPGEGKGGIC